MNLKIRLCKQDDFQEVFKLLQSLWEGMELNSSDLQTVYTRAIASETQRLIVGMSANHIVGFCSLTIKNNLWVAGNSGHIDELVVDYRYRGHGIGKKLIKRITEIAKENACKKIELDSAFHRKKAHDFYTSVGYENRAYLFSKEIT